jgi:hypothetical protein
MNKLPTNFTWKIQIDFPTVCTCWHWHLTFLPHYNNKLNTICWNTSWNWVEVEKNKHISLMKELVLVWIKKMSHIGYDIPTSSVYITGGDFQGCALGVPTFALGDTIYPEGFRYIHSHENRSANCLEIRSA